MPTRYGPRMTPQQFAARIHQLVDAGRYEDALSLDHEHGYLALQLAAEEREQVAALLADATHYAQGRRPARGTNPRPPG